MRYFNIKRYSSENGIGIGTSIFFTGCTLRCPGCHNKEIWDFKSGKPFDTVSQDLVIQYLRDKHISHLSILGGEPLDQDLSEMREFLEKVRLEVPTKKIWLWTGYTIEELKKSNRNTEKLSLVYSSLLDFIVDGPFIESLKSPTLLFRGSKNQTIWEYHNGGVLIRSDLNDK